MWHIFIIVYETCLSEILPSKAEILRQTKNIGVIESNLREALILKKKQKGTYISLQSIYHIKSILFPH